MEVSNLEEEFYQAWLKTNTEIKKYIDEAKIAINKATQLCEETGSPYEFNISEITMWYKPESFWNKWENLFPDEYDDIWNGKWKNFTDPKYDDLDLDTLHTMYVVPDGWEESQICPS